MIVLRLRLFRKNGESRMITDYLVEQRARKLRNLAAGKVRGCSPLPVVHMGRRMLVRRESLLRWIEQTESGRVEPRKTA